MLFCESPAVLVGYEFVLLVSPSRRKGEMISRVLYSEKMTILSVIRVAKEDREGGV